MNQFVSAAIGGSGKKLSRNRHHLGLGRKRALHERLIRLEQAVEQQSNRIRRLRFTAVSLFGRRFLWSRARIKQGIHDRNACHSIRQTVMDADDQPGALVFVTMYKRKVPQRPAAIQRRADNLRGHRLQVGIRSPLENNSVNVVSDVEVRIEFPSWQAEVEGREYRTLLVARKEVEFRLDIFSAGVDRDRAIELAGTGNVQRLTFALQIQKECVSPRQRINPAGLRHGDPLVQPLVASGTRHLSSNSGGADRNHEPAYF